MKAYETPDQIDLVKVFSYDKETGFLHWKNKKNKVAGGKIRNGYIRVRVFGGRYLAHRLIWKIVHGVDPLHEIDHINGDASDNRIINLRECTRSENCMNRGLFKNNSFGMKGVSYHDTMRKFRATIYRNKERIMLGFFDTAEQAYSAYLCAKKEIHGNFSHNGQQGVQASKGIQ